MKWYKLEPWQIFWREMQAIEYYPEHCIGHALSRASMSVTNPDKAIRHAWCGNSYDPKTLNTKADMNDCIEIWFGYKKRTHHHSVN